MKINVSRLPFLLQISRSGGVLAAADAMRVTPSAISQQLSRLEAEVGVPLVDRTPKGIVPTAAGREIIELAETVEREVNEAALRVGEVSKLPSGLVRFGGFQSFISEVLAPAMQFWRTELAGVQLQIVEADQPDLLRGLRRADFDIIAVEADESQATAPLSPGTSEVALLDDSWVLVAPAGTQASMGHVEVPQLRLPWLEVDGEVSSFHAMRRIRGTDGGANGVTHRYSTHQTALALVAAGEGVTILPQLMLREQEHEGVETHELPGLGVRYISLRYRAGAKPDPAVTAAVDLLRAIAVAREVPLRT